MDRRDFLKYLVAAPMASPLLSIPQVEDSGSTLYLIADDPQSFLPTIVAGMNKRGWIQGRRPSLREEILRRSAPPTFTLFRNGRVWDLRDRELGRLWLDMNSRGAPSTRLTIASFPEPTSLPSPGKTADVFYDGKKHETLSLCKNQVRRYQTLRGHVLIRVESGKAKVLTSSCRHKICQSSPPVFLAGERIICAPNHFFLSIDGPRFIDTVTG